MSGRPSEKDGNWQLVPAENGTASSSWATPGVRSAWERISVHFGQRLREVALKGGWAEAGDGSRTLYYVCSVLGLRYTVCAALPDAPEGVEVAGGEPKVAVLFEVVPKADGKAEYLRRRAELRPEVLKMPSFISVKRFASLSEEGKLLSVSVWENEQALHPSSSCSI